MVIDIFTFGFFGRLLITSFITMVVSFAINSEVSCGNSIIDKIVNVFTDIIFYISLIAFTSSGFGLIWTF